MISCYTQCKRNHLGKVIRLKNKALAGLEHECIGDIAISGIIKRILI